MSKNNDYSEVSWGNVLADDALVWIPHALCRHADKLELTFDDIGFIAQCFSFRGPTGIHPSESTLAIRGGYNTRNPIINRFKRLEKMNLINRHRIRYEDGTFGTYRYDFSPLREKLEQLVKAEWASGERKSKQRSDSKEPIHVDDNQYGEHQHDDHQHDERQHKKHKGKVTQGFRNAKDTETTTNLPIREKDAQIGISDGDIINGVQDNNDSSDGISDDTIHSETGEIGGEVNDGNKMDSDSDNRASIEHDNLSDSGVSSGSDNRNSKFCDSEQADKLTYMQSVVDYFNGLKAKHPTKISQRTTRPAKLSTVEKYKTGKYRAALQWYNQGIPLEKICDALDAWVSAHAGAPVPLNYFMNHDVPVELTEIDPEALAYVKKYFEEE